MKCQNTHCYNQLTDPGERMTFVKIVEFTDVRVKSEIERSDPIIPARAEYRVCISCLAEMIKDEIIR